MKKTIRFLLWGTFFVYCFAILCILFLSSRGYWNDLTFLEYIKRFSNFVPFRTIAGYIQGITKDTMNFDIPIKNIFGNLFLFLPMGLYLPCMFKKLRTLGKFILCIFAILPVVEVFQLLLRRGSFDIDDIIMNIIGAIIGFGIWKNIIIQKLLHKLYLIK